MSDKTRLTSSLQRLLRKSGEPPGAALGASWFAGEIARRGRLELSHAGEDTYVTRVLDAHDGGEDGLALVVDPLIPEPDDDFWLHPVSLSGTLTTFEAGLEEIVSFRARVGERLDVDGQPGVELTHLADIERQQREYVATPGRAHSITLSFVWFDSWVDVHPSRFTIRRFHFQATLEDFTAPDGYAISRAMLKLEKGGTAVPVKLHLTRGLNGEFTAELEAIDGVFRQKLTALVEEIWRTDAGLSRRKAAATDPEVGYMTRSRDDTLAAATTPAVLFAGEDEHWRDLLGEVGQVEPLSGVSIEELSEKLAESPCDLFVGDADIWGARAVGIERLLRSVSRFRAIPRIWISSGEIGAPWDPTGITLEDGSDSLIPSEDDGSLDHVDFGAFDLVPRDIEDDLALRRLRWALGGDAHGRGEGVLLVTQDQRVRYRLGISLLDEPGVRFVTFNRAEGLLPTLEKRLPRWVVLDAGSFEVELHAMLSRSADWVAHHRGHVILLSRGASPEQVTGWLRAGADDIILLDPSLREAMRRLRARVLRNAT